MKSWLVVDLMQFQTLQSFSSLQCIKDYFALGIFKLFAQISEIAT
jgi:hypothetical protein